MDAHVIDDLYRDLTDTTGIGTPAREPLRVWTLSGVERLHRSDTGTVIFKYAAAPFTGEHVLRHVRAFVDEVVRVSDDEIAQALRLVIERCKLAAEPSGAAAYAAVLSKAVAIPEGARVICVVSGGNADPAVLKRIL